MPRNIPLFIAFRLLFNARFYYPVFAVIQLDYGLTMAQFAILNAVWAVSIVVLKVPSGALADRPVLRGPLDRGRQGCGS